MCSVTAGDTEMGQILIVISLCEKSTEDSVVTRARLLSCRPGTGSLGFLSPLVFVVLQSPCVMLSKDTVLYLAFALNDVLTIFVSSRLLLVVYKIMALLKIGGIWGLKRYGNFSFKQCYF